jgi:hypothetical protein
MLNHEYNMIPKIIHYCWFGKGSLPMLAFNCIESWKYYLPDYKIMLWDENNFDVECIPYVSQAYKLKKFAFVSDYARFHILSQFGGIYMDTDVEVIKSLDEFLHHKLFTGFENNERVAPGLILGAEKGNQLIGELMDSYNDKEFVLSDGRLNMETVVTYTTNILIKKGLRLDGTLQEVANATIYPVEYFSPKSYFTGKTFITENTYSIHHYAGSWVPWYNRTELAFWQWLGMHNYQIIAQGERKMLKIIQHFSKK